MNQKQRKRCTAEFKTQAVELLETGRPVAEIAEELCITFKVNGTWMGSVVSE